MSAVSLAAEPLCTADDRACVLSEIEKNAQSIDNVAWRDQTYRELAKTYAFEGHTDKAIALIPLIKTPDTQAMTIRGIGMAAADKGYTTEQYTAIFASLRAEAEKIGHAPSHAIALTYIAMAQAFARDNEGAWKTAADMKNDALRHKAYAETAEVQAERGDFKAAMHSIELIDSEAFRNKALSVISKIAANAGAYQAALEAATLISNPFKKAEAMQFMLDAKKPREVKRDSARLSPAMKSDQGGQP